MIEEDADRRARENAEYIRGDDIHGGDVHGDHQGTGPLQY
jgi:hypothetical protein